MTGSIKPRETGKQAKTSESKKAGELDDKALEEVSGGKIGQACATGQHIKGGVITT